MAQRNQGRMFRAGETHHIVEIVDIQAPNALTVRLPRGDHLMLKLVSADPTLDDRLDAEAMVLTERLRDWLAAGWPLTANIKHITSDGEIWGTLDAANLKSHDEVLCASGRALPWSRAERDVGYRMSHLFEPVGSRADMLQVPLHYGALLLPPFAIQWAGVSDLRLIGAEALSVLGLFIGTSELLMTCLLWLAFAMWLPMLVRAWVLFADMAAGSRYVAPLADHWIWTVMIMGFCGSLAAMTFLGASLPGALGFLEVTIESGPLWYIIVGAGVLCAATSTWMFASTMLRSRVP